jgi:mono/diheme cytochrome c family protein
MVRFLVLAAMLVSGWLGALLYAQRTPADGVYTTAQAAAGEAVYETQCAGCHGPTLGGAAGPPLRGDGFQRKWGGRSLDELLTKVQNTMPANDPGKLSRDQSLALLAYVLQAGDFPAGREALGDEATLKQIAFAGAAAPAPPASASAAAMVLAVRPVGNMAQLMRGVLFPSSNIIFSVQGQDPAAPKPPYNPDAGGFNWADWGAGIYPGWEVVDYAAISIADVAPLLLVPRSCENGKPAPVERDDWVKYTHELVDAARAVLKASQARNQDIVSEATNQLADACLNCHVAYRDKEGGTVADPSNKAARCQP